MSEEIELAWHMADAIDEAFSKEGGSLSGKEMWEQAERTDALLRTSWPIIKAALPAKVAA